ncbi:MAG: Hsp70 family protein [Polyangiaceae bacterium]
MLHEKPSLYAIDFGTSNSLLAAVTPTTAHAPLAIDAAAQDPTVLRSILFFSESNEWHFGGAALERYLSEGMRGRFMRSLKRFLPMLSFEETRLGSRLVKLEELIGVFLREMRNRANVHYEADVRRVLLGRPARFADDPEADHLAEQRLERAARFAGFDEVHFCPEPVAAAYDFKSRLTETKVVLIADFGGGTSDFTVARLVPGADHAEVLAIGGVSVAGDAFDGAIMRHKVSRHFGAEVTYRMPFGKNVLTMPRSLMEALCVPADTCLLGRRDIMSFLRDVRGGSLGPDDKQHVDQLLCLVEDALGFQVFEAIERAKRTLSVQDSTSVEFDYPGIELCEPVTRTEFERFSSPQVETILGSLDRTLEASGMIAGDIDLVCCTGGTARVAGLSSGIASRFEPNQIVRLRSLHSVIQGLAERAKAYA